MAEITKSPVIVLESDRDVTKIGLSPEWEKNPDPTVTAVSDRAYDLAQPYGIDIHPKSLRGTFYTADEGAFAFYNAFIKKFHTSPVGEGRPPIERQIQIQEFVYLDPEGNKHLESDINNPMVWTTKRLYEYIEMNCPEVAVTLPKFISDSHYELLVEAMKSTLTVIGAPVRDIQVPWGIVKYPGDEEIKIYPTVDEDSYSEPVFRLQVLAKKRDMHLVQEFVDAVMHELHQNNLYKGRCFNWNKGKITYFDPFPGTVPANLVFSRKLLTVFENEVLNPIIYADRARQINPQLLSQKIILSGQPGTGKTEMTNWIAQVALQHGTTVGYLEPGSNLDDLNQFTTFMAKNTPGIKVIEDIETYMPDTEGMTKKQALEARSLILSIFDGASSKSVALHTVVTTNYEEVIASAMLRSGRCDVFIRTEAPDREAFEKLVRMRIQQWLDDNTDFDALWSEVGNMSSSFLSNGLVMKGMKYALKGGDDYKLSADDFIAMIGSLRGQFDLYEENATKEREERKDTLTEAFSDVVKSATNETVSVR